LDIGLSEELAEFDPSGRCERIWRHELFVFVFYFSARRFSIWLGRVWLYAQNQPHHLRDTISSVGAGGFLNSMSSKSCAVAVPE
jgi:hypothetical protein